MPTSDQIAATLPTVAVVLVVIAFFAVGGYFLNRAPEVWKVIFGGVGAIGMLALGYITFADALAALIPFAILVAIFGGVAVVLALAFGIVALATLVSAIIEAPRRMTRFGRAVTHKAVAKVRGHRQKGAAPVKPEEEPSPPPA